MHRILILEDHRIIATDLAQTVELVPECTATVTASAQEALARSGAVRFDVALIGIDLGAEDDGIEVALALREQFGTRSIVVSAYLDGPARRRAASAEPLGFLSKPFVGADVVGMLCGILGAGARTKTGSGKESRHTGRAPDLCSARSHPAGRQETLPCRQPGRRPGFRLQAAREPAVTEDGRVRRGRLAPGPRARRSPPSAPGYNAARNVSMNVSLSKFLRPSVREYSNEVETPQVV